MIEQRGAAVVQQVQPEPSESATPQPEPKRARTRVRAEHRYPVYDLNASIDVAIRIHERAGGSATPDHIASFLEYSSTRSGAFLTRISAASMFGLIDTSDRAYTVTPLGLRILAPEHPDVTGRAARAEAFENVPLYRLLYDRYEGHQLPPELGVRHVMQTDYGIPQARTQVGYRVLMDSAKQAGFFNARGGQRTHLVRPTIGGPNIEPGIGAGEEEPEAPPGDAEQPSTPPPPARASTVTEKLQEALVEKIREIPAEDIDKVREYIAEIRRLREIDGDEEGDA